MDRPSCRRAHTSSACESSHRARSIFRGNWARPGSACTANCSALRMVGTVTPNWAASCSCVRPSARGPRPGDPSGVLPRPARGLGDPELVLPKPLGPQPREPVHVRRQVRGFPEGGAGVLGLQPPDAPLARRPASGRVVGKGGCGVFPGRDQHLHGRREGPELARADHDPPVREAPDRVDVQREFQVQAARVVERQHLGEAVQAVRHRGRVGQQARVGRGRGYGCQFGVQRPNPAESGSQVGHYRPADLGTESRVPEDIFHSAICFSRRGDLQLEGGTPVGLPVRLTIQFALDLGQQRGEPVRSRQEIVRPGRCGW